MKMKVIVMIGLLCASVSHAGCKEEYRRAIRSSTVTTVGMTTTGLAVVLVGGGSAFALTKAGFVGAGVTSGAAAMMGMYSWGGGWTEFANGLDLRDAWRTIRAGYEGKGRHMERYTQLLREQLEMELTIEEVAGAIVALDQANAFCRDLQPDGVWQVQDKVIHVLKPE